MPDLVLSISIRHDADKIDPDIFRVDFMFVYIEECSTLERLSLGDTECIERMTMQLILPIADLNKYSPFAISGYDIYLSALYLVIACDNLISSSFQIGGSDLFAIISD